MTNDKKSSLFPGPNVYTPKDSYTKIATAAWGIGSAQRGNLSSRNIGDSPGPGTYDTATKGAGPKYHMGEKTAKLLREAVPGPGAYEPKHEAVK